MTSGIRGKASERWTFTDELSMEEALRVGARSLREHYALEFGVSVDDVSANPGDVRRDYSSMWVSVTVPREAYERIRFAAGPLVAGFYNPSGAADVQPLQKPKMTRLERVAAGLAPDPYVALIEVLEPGGVVARFKPGGACYEAAWAQVRAKRRLWDAELEKRYPTPATLYVQIQHEDYV